MVFKDGWSWKSRSFGGTHKKLKDDGCQNQCCRSISPRDIKATSESRDLERWSESTLGHGGRPAPQKPNLEISWGAHALASIFRAAGEENVPELSLSQAPSKSIPVRHMSQSVATRAVSSTGSDRSAKIPRLDPSSVTLPTQHHESDSDLSDEDAKKVEASALKLDIWRLRTEIDDSKTELEEKKLEIRRLRTELEEAKTYVPPSMMDRLRPVPRGDLTSKHRRQNVKQSDFEESEQDISEIRNTGSDDITAPISRPSSDVSETYDAASDDEITAISRPDSVRPSSTGSTTPTSEPRLLKRHSGLSIFRTLSAGSQKARSFFGGHKKSTHPFAPERSNGNMDGTEHLLD